jgi:hypothetical protein
VGIVDIFGTVERVKIKQNPDEYVDIIGWSGKAIATLLRRFPFMVKLFSGQMTAKDVAEMEPDAVSTAISWAIKGGQDNPDLEKVFADLPIGIQMEVFKAIGRVTFQPKGVGPFLKDLYGWGAEPLEGASATPGMNSQKPSSASVDTPTPSSGISPPVN